jgi:hypothetical protein
MRNYHDLQFRRKCGGTVTGTPTLTGALSCKSPGLRFFEAQVLGSQAQATGRPQNHHFEGVIPCGTSCRSLSFFISWGQIPARFHSHRDSLPRRIEGPLRISCSALGNYTSKVSFLAGFLVMVSLFISWRPTTYALILTVCHGPRRRSSKFNWRSQTTINHSLGETPSGA